MSGSDDDAIGRTIYSKQWLIKLLKRTVKFVDSEFIFRINPFELDDLADRLDVLWEMSSDEDVQKFLIETDVSMLTFAFSETRNERLSNLLIGILANLVHNTEISDIISNDESFCSYVITLLSAPDTEFLIQLIRFLNTILLRTNANNNPWLSLIEKNDEQFFNQIDHLFSNSLNNELLKALFRYINDLLYKNNDLGKHWCKGSWLKSLCCAISHLLNDVDVDKETLFNFWFIVQTLSNNNIQLSQFIPNLNIMLRVLQKFDELKNFNSVNSINALSAACLIFTQLDSLENKDSGVEWKKFKEDMINNKVIEVISIKYAIYRKERPNETETDNDTYNHEQILSIIDKFFQIFTKKNEDP